MSLDREAIRQRLAEAHETDPLAATTYRTSDGHWTCTLACADNSEAEIADVHDFGYIGLFAHAAADMTDLLAEVDRLHAAVQRLEREYQVEGERLYEKQPSDLTAAEIYLAVAANLRNITGGTQ